MDDINEEINEQSIAIIGMSGRFPGAKNVDEFWQNLKDGVESIRFFSDQELLDSGIDPAILKDSHYVKAKGALDNIAEFDAAFFGLSPKEAEITDPQQRLFLECAWEALENAGYDPKTYSGSIGVYGGIGSLDTYFLKNLFSNQEVRENIGDFQIVLSNYSDSVCTRVSYKLNLRGPSVSIQTACSTSLVAVIMGYQSLLDYQCDMVLAGGATITVPQKAGYLYQEGMIFSPDGHCRAFDAKAKGAVDGNGVGIVILKRLTDALDDGDNIYAIIRGAAINNDGASKVGYTAPSVDGQTRVVTEALTLAETSPETIGYIETHGTGTPLGDPIEIAALTQAFRANTDQKGYCAIGSVKTNIGHLDAAAGVTGLIKAVLTLKHQIIPPSLHFETPNPKLDLPNSPFYVNTTLSEWKTQDFPRRAGVNSFGIGGTNAHVILEEAPNQQSTIENQESKRPWQLLLLSAKTDTALETATTQLIEHFKQHPELNLADVAYTYQIGRSAFKYRRLLVCKSLEDAVSALETPDTKRVLTQTVNNDKKPAVVFMFSGQGSQYVNMGLELYQIESVFREQIDHCAEFLKPHLGLDLRTVLYPSQEQQTEVASQQLKQTAITQPALFVIEYALAQLWKTWGIQPKAMIGHSIGEYVAACLAGVFTLEEALILVAVRGRLIQSVPAGAMLAVPLTEEKILPLLNQNIDLAAVNVSSQSVVSGTLESVEQLTAQLAEQGVECQRLHTYHAFHSEMMTPILPVFLKQVQEIQLKPPQIPFISNVTGTWISNAEATDPNYWIKHLRQTVRFAAGLQKIFQTPSQILLEVGPGRTLSTFTKRHPDNTGQLVLTSLRHPKDEHSDSAFILKTLGQLWMNGITVNWSRFYADEQRCRLPLPTYPFERQRYWIEAQTQIETVKPRADLLRKKSDIADWFYIPSWKRTATPVYNASGLIEPSCWLVFMDECGLGSQLVKQLKKHGQDIITVTIGEQFNYENTQTYTLNPQHHEDYNALLKALSAQNKRVKTIIHLWTVTSNNDTESGLEFLDKLQNLGFYSLLFLAQALGKQNVTDILQIEVISNHLQMVIGEETLYPEKATLLGPCKVIPQEYPNITCRNIDIVLPDSGISAEDTLINQLLSEFTAEKTDSIIAYRNNHRWVKTFEATRLEKNIGTSKLRKKGVYLITGGLGGIGLALAEYLARTVQAKLILTTRSDFPVKNEWKQWLATHNEQDSISRKIKKVQIIEALGAEVLIISADVTNIKQMRATIADSLERFGQQIHGVIHTAGVPGGGVIQRKTRETVESIIIPKLKGTLVLDRIFKKTQLDFLVLCSSLTSIEGGFGQVDYCAANAFIDAFVHFKATKNGIYNVVSIGWDGWQEVGMAFEAAKQHAGTLKLLAQELQDEISPSDTNVIQKTLKKGLLSAEGIEVFNRILHSKNSQVFISTRDLYARLEKNVSSIVQTSSKKPISISKSLYSRPQLDNDYVVPRNELEQTITDVWEKFLGIERVGIFDDFFDLGGDSLMVVQLVSELNRIIQVKLSAHSLLENTTIAALAESIQPMLIADTSSNQSGLQKALPQSLVKMQVGNSLKKPLFLVHPIGGHIYIYRNLTRSLGNQQPVYAFKAQGVDGETQPLTQIEAMATHYINAMQVVQPEGPYILGGHSFGGLVAFEMAQQLHVLGQEIALLFMMDTVGPEQSLEPEDSDDIRAIAYALGLDANLDLPVPSEQFSQLELEEQIRYFYEHSKTDNQTYPKEFVSHIRNFLYVIKANNQVMNDYIPRTYQGHLLFFRAKERDKYLPTNPEHSWINLATEVDIHEIPGNHTSMNFSPNIEIMTKILKTYLDNQ
jgi:acyl transferase domain-containing protein/thioesterase domain-containing protein/acyl carrier protein